MPAAFSPEQTRPYLVSKNQTILSVLELLFELTNLVTRQLFVSILEKILNFFFFEGGELNFLLKFSRRLFHFYLWKNSERITLCNQNLEFLWKFSRIEGSRRFSFIWLCQKGFVNLFISGEEKRDVSKLFEDFTKEERDNSLIFVFLSFSYSLEIKIREICTKFVEIKIRVIC